MVDRMVQMMHHSGASPSTRQEGFTRAPLSTDCGSRMSEAPHNSHHPLDHRRSEDVLSRSHHLDHIRNNKMYNSLNRAHAGRGRVNRRGSSDDILSTTHDGRPLSPEMRPFSTQMRPLSPDTRPLSPRDESMLLGNLGFEELEDSHRVFSQEVSIEVHAPIDHFIRSEHRLVFSALKPIIVSVYVWCNSKRYLWL